MKPHFDGQSKAKVLSDFFWVEKFTKLIEKPIL